MRLCRFEHPESAPLLVLCWAALKDRLATRRGELALPDAVGDDGFDAEADDDEVVNEGADEEAFDDSAD